MELAVWIVGILAAALVLLCRTRVGVHATLTGRSAVIKIRIGPLGIQVFPAKGQEAKGPQKPRSTQAASAERTGRTAHRPQAEDLREAARTLWPPLRRALARTRRGIRVQPFAVSVTLGGAEDPAETARIYGLLHAAVWTGMPALEELLDIRDPGIHLGMDFDAAKTTAEGCVGLSIRIGTLLSIGLGVGIPALRWLLAYRRKKQAAQPARAAA